MQSDLHYPSSNLTTPTSFSSLPLFSFGSVIVSDSIGTSSAVLPGMAASSLSGSGVTVVGKDYVKKFIFIWESGKYHYSVCLFLSYQCLIVVRYSDGSKLYYSFLIILIPLLSS